MAKILQVVALNITNINLCQEDYRRQTKLIPESQICAGGEENKDSCNGDSGGGLLKLNKRKGRNFYTVVGLVSFGPEYCGTANRHGVYTKIRAYKDWIRENIGSDKLCKAFLYTVGILLGREVSTTY